jgi:hypothetical protein
VAICRSSGARATDACRRAGMIPADIAEGSPQLPGVDSMYPAAAVRVQPPSVEQSMVYEDLFPLGAAPSDTCPVDGAADAAPVGASGTPMVDGILQETALSSLPRLATMSAIRAAAPLVVERVLQSDGTYRIVIRQR